MARFRDLISSFLLGEVSPKVLGRADLDQYKQMCEEITNFIVMPQGGVKRRPGTQFLSDNTTFNNADVTGVKLVPFVISKTESYILVFDDESPSTGHPVLSNGEDAGITIYSVDDGSIHYPVPLEDNSPVYELPIFRGYSSKLQISEMQYAQYGNTIFFAQKNKIPFAITKDADGFTTVPFWAYSEIVDKDFPSTASIAKAWPYQTRNTDSSITVTPDGTTGDITLTSSADIFTEDMEGSTIRITASNGSKTGVVIITDFVSADEIDGHVLVTLGTTSASSNWAFSSWGEVPGWPRSVAFFQNRIIYGGNEAQPNAIWGSRSGNVSDMKQEPYIDASPNTVVNSDPLEFSVAATELSQIQWLSAGKSLAIGTLGREYVAYGPDTSQSFGPLNFNFDAETAYGSKAVQPVRRDNSLLFVQRSGRKCRELVFNFQEDAYKAEDIMIFAPHMTRRTDRMIGDDASEVGEIVEMVHQEADDQLTWFRDSNGGLFSVTRNKDLQITAFHYHPIAGPRAAADIADVLSICVAPSPDGSHDDLYLMVKRTINGASVNYLERINREFELENVYNAFSDIGSKPIFIDSAAINIEVSAVLEHEGFSHLKAMTVHVIADGYYVGPKVVDSDGHINLAIPAKEVIAGLPFRSTIKPSSINIGSVIGTSQGAVKTLDQVTLRFVRTIGAKFGFSIDDLLDVNFRDPVAEQNSPIALFTGDKELSPPQGWDTNLSVVVVQDLPFPCELSAMILRGVTND